MEPDFSYMQLVIHTFFSAFRLIAWFISIHDSEAGGLDNRIFPAPYAV